MSSLQASAHPAHSLMAITRQRFLHASGDLVESAFEVAISKDNHYTLFRWEDWPAWVTFAAVFLLLITLDNIILNRNPKALTMARAAMYTLFWVSMACCFAGWVYWYYGERQAYMWMSGYMLEWMLSFDNLFVFHMIFSVYGCPDSLKHRPLYMGILGAVFFRLVFLLVGEYLIHAFVIMHFVFGSFLVWTGIKTITTEDEDEDPSQHPLVLWLQKRVPFLNAYDSKASFFVHVAVDEAGEPIMPRVSQAVESDHLLARDQERESVPVYDFQADLDEQGWSGKTQKRATMLFLVVVCLEFSDLLFAVDSVSAIVAQVNDLFLAFTSAIFAMLGLRATFFIIDVLVKLFSLLKYGVGIVLTFVGMKLIVGHMFYIPPSVVCLVLVTALLGSVLASIVQDEMEKKEEGKVIKDVEQRIAKVMG